MFENLDNLEASQDNSPKGKAEAALLALLQTYPEAAKYLGKGALPYLQQIAEKAVDPKTSRAAAGIAQGLGGL